MPDLLLNGNLGVLSGRVEMPRVGRWTADLQIDSATVPTGAVTLASTDGTLSLKGTVRRGGSYVEAGYVHLVGGAGGLEGEAQPVYYRSVTLATPLRALLESLGETLSPTSDVTALNTFLPRWTRERGPGGPALARLAEAAGVGWRVLDDGSVWLGRDTFADAGVGEDTYELLQDVPAEFRVLIAGDQIPSKIRPGATFRGKRVAFVEYRLDTGGTVSTAVWFERDAPNSHPVLGPMQSVIRDTMRETRYHALYPARVQSQGTDDSVDVVLDDDSLPPMTQVPLYKFAPGIAVKIAPGARVLIAFAGGDPSKPLALAFESGTTTQVPVKDCGTLTFLPNAGTAPAVLAYFPPGALAPPETGSTKNFPLQGRIES